DFLLYTAVQQETLTGLWEILRQTAQSYFCALTPSCPDIAVRVENYLEAHYSDCSLTVQSIAWEMGFTNSYLCASYKKSCGKTINQRLTEIRLHHSKALLAETGRMLYEVANAVGYVDGKYFVKLFTREEGLSPKEYRGRHSYEK
ncbi:MAG: helix-turn-helix transcriptional regulator, partial [Oscillospiraceae bacterium]